MPHLNVVSYASSEGLGFVSCSGQVLKAWDVGVSSMERGEVSIFLCAPEYAYGVAGNPDKIPPNSAVVFEVGAPGQRFWWRISFSVTQFFCFNPLHSVYSLSVHKNQWYFQHTHFTKQKSIYCNCHSWRLLSTCSYLFLFNLFYLSRLCDDSYLFFFCLLPFPPPTPTPSWGEAWALSCFI